MEIYNANDQTGLGMFSKPGKLSNTLVLVYQKDTTFKNLKNASNYKKIDINKI